MTRKNRIQHKLNDELLPSYLNVEDESKNHHVPEGAETHFKVIAVSEQFTEQSRLARHRLVNKLLGDEFNQGMHALSLHLYTPAEWALKHESVLNSPNCKDGYKTNRDTYNNS